MHKISRALLSVSDKTGIVEFARALAEMGVELISTGGTAKTLREHDIPVSDISLITGFPEMMDGRVKTLHPNVHGALLALLDNPDHVQQMDQHGIRSIDLLALNLYPFRQTLERADATHEQIIENIDIGGPAMLRSAAKNYRFTAVATDPGQYSGLVQELRDNQGCLTPDTLLGLAGAAFRHVADYDELIAGYFRQIMPGESHQDDNRLLPPELRLNLVRQNVLRYGENPHQQAALYGSFGSVFTQLHGKELSYNNIVDIDAAAKLVAEFPADTPTIAIIKHTNPCGVGAGDTVLQAWEKALACDPVSAFGGIIAMNTPPDLQAAQAMNQIFTEVIIAPDFPDDALELLRKKKDRRLIRMDLNGLKADTGLELKTVAGGILAQGADDQLLDESVMRVVTRKQPTQTQMDALMFAWRVAKHVKSNAIVYASTDRTLGVGAGQMSRVDSAMIAVHKAERAGISLADSAVASDAFFPFADGLLEAVKAGATAVIQPGGSVRDQEVIDAADQHGIAMVMTGMRHFKH